MALGDAPGAALGLARQAHGGRGRGTGGHRGHFQRRCPLRSGRRPALLSNQHGKLPSAAEGTGYDEGLPEGPEEGFAAPCGRYCSL